MSLAIVFEDDSVAFLDAVTDYSKSKSSSVSNHPVDRSALVTDHISKDNPSFTVRAVISAGDFHTSSTRPQELLEGSENNPPISPEMNQPVSGARISDQSGLLDYLPGSVQQILGTINTSDISLDPFRGYTHEIARDRFIRAWEASEILTILDYDYDIAFGRYISIRVIEDCIMERFEDTEGVDTGDSLVANLTFRQIRYATVKEVDVEIDQAPPSSSVADRAASESNEGDLTNTGEESENAERRVVEKVGGRLEEFGGAFKEKAKQLILNSDDDTVDAITGG